MTKQFTTHKFDRQVPTTTTELQAHYLDNDKTNVVEVNMFVSSINYGINFLDFYLIKVKTYFTPFENDQNKYDGYTFEVLFSERALIGKPRINQRLLNYNFFNELHSQVTHITLQV